MRLCAALWYVPAFMVGEATAIAAKMHISCRCVLGLSLWALLLPQPFRNTRVATFCTMINCFMLKAHPADALLVLRVFFTVFHIVQRYDFIEQMIINIRTIIFTNVAYYIKIHVEI